MASRKPLVKNAHELSASMRPVLLSKRANVFYFEHVRIMQRNDCVVFMTNTRSKEDQIFNLPDKNTAFVLLGKGTSITDQAARKLAESGVLVGFVGSGGSPIYAITEPVFLTPHSEYGPTEYMQKWVLNWMNESLRLSMAKALLIRRITLTQKLWTFFSKETGAAIVVPETAKSKFLASIQVSKDTQSLLLAEALWAKSLYAAMSGHYGMKFIRCAGGRVDTSPVDRANSFLDHGNYLAYGYSGVTLSTLGISFAFPVLHGKTRRGALVFDIADLFKDGLVMPLAFHAAATNKDDKYFRAKIIDYAFDLSILDTIFDTIKELIELKPQ